MELDNHLDWRDRHAHWLEYRADRVKLHREMARQYFSAAFNPLN
jgi:hypothetical protein